MIQAPLAIVVVLAAVIYLSLQLTERFVWARRVSAVLLILFLAAAASNLGLIPTEAPIYGQLIGLTVPLAVCLILFKVNLADVRRAGRAMIVAFLIASLGTVLGVLLAGLALAPALERALGDEAWKLAGPYTGTYVGGSLNFFALWEGLEIGQPDLFAAANAVDNLTIFPLFAIWMLVPSLLGHRFAVAAHWRREGALSGDDEPQDQDPPRLVPTEIVGLLLAALLVLALSEWIKARFLDAVAPQVPTILLVTTLALGLGQLPAVRRRQGAWELGHLSFYLFFAAIGAMINVYNAVVLSPILFAYVMIIIVVHMVVIYGCGRLLRMDVGVLTVASTATKAGPPLVLAITETKGWHELALPGVVVGLLGYAAGNYVGFAAAQAMRLLLG